MHNTLSCSIIIYLSSKSRFYFSVHTMCVFIDLAFVLYQVTLKIKVRSADAPVQSAKFMGHGICDNITKSSSLRQASRDDRLIHSVCYHQLWRSLSIKPADLRGVSSYLLQYEEAWKQGFCHAGLGGAPNPLVIQPTKILN